MGGFTSLERYAPSNQAADRLLPIFARAGPARAGILHLPQGSRLRREALLRLMAWGYGQFNATGQMPAYLWTRDLVINQTAALLGTTGTFRGRESLQSSIRELTDAFNDVRLTPESFIELAKDRLLFTVRFSGSGAGSGIPTDTLIAHVWSLDLRTGAASRLDVYWEVSEALEAVGLSE
ncbi:MAG: hypothetical protein M3356_03265 [Actinomycetota bacterium]|nr:hypothetical protein [Actinomycetota bacterium]